MEKFFNSKDIKTFEPKDLDDKFLHVKSFENEGVTITIAKDLQTNNIYVLDIKFEV